LGTFPKCGGVELKFHLVLGPLLWNSPYPRTLPYTKESPTHVKMCLKVSFVFEEPFVKCNIPHNNFHDGRFASLTLKPYLKGTTPYGGDIDMLMLPQLKKYFLGMHHHHTRNKISLING
jgi:hypothetical protein